jgi:hypothetical protein
MVEKTGLKNIAAKLDPPQAPTPAARRQARVRARRRNGVHIYRIEVSDGAAEGLILRFILDGQLTETQALEHGEARKHDGGPIGRRGAATSVNS